MDISTQFEYERLSRAIDSCQDIEALKHQTKSLLKLYYSQKEITYQLLVPSRQSKDESSHLF